MKTTFQFIWILTTLVFVSWSAARLEYHHYELTDAEQIDFGARNESNHIKGSMRRASFDGTTSHITYDTSLALTVFEWVSSTKSTTAELTQHLCSGSVRRQKQHLVIDAVSYGEKLYLLGHVDGKMTIDSFDHPITITLTAKDYQGDYCPVLMSLWKQDASPSFVAVPTDVHPKKVYKRRHKKEDIGRFSQVQISSGGKVQNYPNGKYVLVGGNSLLLAPGLR